MAETIALIVILGIALFVLAGSMIGFVAQAMLYAAFAGYLTVLIAARRSGL